VRPRANAEVHGRQAALLVKLCEQLVLTVVAVGVFIGVQRVTNEVPRGVVERVLILPLLRR
jgi:hypothetical protein